jgi:hypothetical protein
MAVMFGRGDDPLTVLRTSPIGDDRARAMTRLAEPGPDRGADQDEAVQLLTTAATSDPSPWVRLAAVDALGRFADPRAGQALVAAYAAAAGKPAGPAPSPIQQAGQRTPVFTGGADLRGPQGFPADQVSGLRVRILDGLAKHGQPAGLALLAEVATDREPQAGEDTFAHDLIRQAAVRNLGAVKKPEAAVALAKVLRAEAGRDVTVATLAHDGLKAVTGKDLPADPAKWDEVVQAGGVPPPAPVEPAGGLDARR